MQNTTADYKIEINKPSRSFECKITIGNNIYTNEDLVNLTLEYTQPQEGFAIGNTISKSLDLTLLNRGDIIYSTSQIKIEIGLRIGPTIEYILMGIFNIDDIEKTDYTTKFTAYDNMIKFETAYFSSLGDKPTLKQVVNELSQITGVEFTGSLPAYTVSKLDGFTCREVLSYVASICGGNAFITRDGKFTIKSLSEVEKSIDGNNYFNYTREEVKYKVGKISCQVDENNILSKGSIGTDSMELGFENQWVTETIITEIYNKLNGLSYLGYSMKWQGDLSLDPYDIITVTDVKNVVRKIPILSQKITYTGGLTSEIGAKGETKNKNSFSSSGSTTNKVNRAVIEQAIIKEALIEKANIKDLEAVSIRTQTLEAKTAKIEELISDVAHIKDLNAINANIEKLIAADATINNALINKADITELNAVKGTINSLDSKIANIETLVNGNLSSENIQAGGITSDKLTISNGFITNAMIANLDVSKINAGDFSTTKFRIVSDSGKMLIADNTIQIRDNNRVRVQIGKDASNDYSMYVWDSAGKLMFDATGLKADGIKNKIIRDDMISDNANIAGSKINISSLVTEINKDTNTTVIKSSKVQLDTVGQTLDVAFNSLKTQSDLTKNNLDNLNIGTRNLATGTKEWNCWTANDGVTITDEYYQGLRIYTANREWGYCYQDIELEENTTYTISCWVKTNVVGTHIGCFVWNANGEGIMTLNEANKWVRYTFTKTNISKWTHRIRVESGNSVNGAKLFICGLKLEKGNKATDWIPAPEDVDSSIESVKQITESNSTTINVMQGQIATAINNTQIVKDGQTILLKDDYNRTVAKVDSINSTIGSHTTKMNELTGSITSVDTKVNSVQRDLEGTKSTVSSHTSQINGLNSTVSTQSSNISQLKNQIALKVEQTDINNAINNIQIGGRNILKKKSNFTYGYFSKVDGYVIDVGYLNANQDFYTNEYFELKKGETIWLSLYKKDIQSNIECGVYIQVYNLNKVWQMCEWKEAPANTNIQVSYTATENCYVRFNSRGYEHYNHKAEYGTKPTDWTPAPEDVSSDIASVDSKVETTSNKLAELKLATDSITQRVQSTESKVTSITTDFNNLQVGGRNLCTGTKDWNGGWREGYNVTLTDEYYQGLRVYTSNNQWAYYYQEVELEENTDYTVSCWVKTNVAGTQVGCYIWNGDGANVVTLNEVDKWVRYSYTHRNPSKWTQIIRIESGNSVNGAKLYLCGLKLEKGTKPTDWTPAPADIDNSISKVDSKIETTKNQVASIETNLNGITQRVSSTESIVSSHTSHLGQVDNKINNAKNQAIVDSRSIPDTRNTNETPEWYMTHYRHQTITEFKQGYVVGISVPFGTLETKVPWGDASGGYPIQIFRSASTPTYERKGISHTEWGAWIQVEDINGSQNKANAAQNNANAYTNGQIASVNQTITDRVADIKLTTDSITSRVHSAEYNISSINGSISNLTSRISTAEQKITPTAITTTISSTISGGTGSISTTQFVMDKNGLTINNGALIIKNKAGKTVLSSDSNGNLLYTGALYAQVDSSHYAKLEPILTNNNKDVKLRLSLVGNTEHSNFDVVNAAGVRLFKVGHGGVEIHKYLTLDTDQTGTYNTKCYWENGTYRPAIAEKALIGTNTYYFNTVYSRFFGRDRISGSYTTVQAGAVNFRTAYLDEGCYFDENGYFRPAAQGAWANGHPSYRWSTLYSVNGVNASSDLKFKENIEYIQETNDTIPLSSKENKITQEDMYNFIKDEFKLASYNYKGEKFEGNTELSYNLGFIAQDLKDSNVGRQFIIPPQEEEGAYSYNMGSYIGVLAGALRIAINKIESLENRIKMLESKGA